MKPAILAIRLRAMGDVVLVTPALRALRRGHAGASLEVVTESRYAPLLEGIADRVWPLERDARSGMRLIASLRKKRYEWAVDFFGNPRSAVITWGSGAKRTAGFDVRGRRLAYRVRVPRDGFTASGAREYAAAAHLRLARAVGGIGDDLDPRLELSAAWRSAGALRLEEAGIDDPSRTVGLVAAGSWPTKAWPVSHAAGLARVLIESGWTVLLIHGPGEEQVTEFLRVQVPGLRLLPRCGVGELAGVIARLGAVVGTDSGPRHLAAALGVPSVAWYGPTHPDTWAPRGERHTHWRTPLPCAACDRTSCPHWNCMPGLTVEHAGRLVLGHLERNVPIAAALGPAARA